MESMNVKTMAIMMISIVVAIIMVVSVLTPIISDSTSETLTYKNTGSYFKAVGGTDAHTIVVSTGQGSFVIKTDNKTDITPTMGTYNPGGQYVSNAIAIGVYEAYNDSGILKSVSGVAPTASTNYNTFRSYALAGNSGVTTGTYELWNFHQYTLVDKIMSQTIMGNTDSQYMLGNVSNNVPNTGLTTEWYQTYSNDVPSSCLFIENGQGSLIEILGDTRSNNLVISAGNTLGGQTVANIKNILTTSHLIPDTNNVVKYIDGMYLNSDIFGLPNSYSDTIGTAGEGINDAMITKTGDQIIVVGGARGNGDTSGLSNFIINNSYSGSYTSIGTRLAYVMTDYQPTTTNYGYVITYGENGNTISDVSVLIDGVLTSKNSSGTTINEYWGFNENGIGPFGSYYVAINLDDVDTTSNVDHLAETMLGTKKGQVAYVLDPTDLTKTLGGTSYTSGDYNIMLVVPTVYWGVSDQKLYMSNSPDTFNSVSGLEMKPYAHTYTLDPSVDTGNPTSTSSATLVYGDEWIVRLYATGDVYLITTNSMINLGQVSGNNTVSFTVTGDSLGYTPVGGSATTKTGALAYISDKGEYVQTKLPCFSVHDGIDFIIGGYANNLPCSEGDIVDIGYCYRVTADGGADDVDSMVVNTDRTATLNPVSDAGYSVDSTTQVWVEESNKADWPGANVMRNVSSDLWQIGDLKVTTTWTDGNDAYDESTATYNYYLAPEIVVYDNPNYKDNGAINSILNIIPLIVIVSIVLGVVGYIAIKRE